MAKNKGYTLIELVVASAVAIVLILSMVTILAPIYRTYQRTLERSDAQLVAENLLDTLRASASTAITLTAEKDGTDDVLNVGSAIYSVSDSGRLMLGSTDVFAPSYYKSKRITMTCTQLVENQVKVTITVSNSEMQLTSVDAVLSSMQAVLGSGYALNTPEGALKALQDAINRYDGTGGTNTPNVNIFRDIYDNIYDGSFPQYSVWSVVERERINALYTDYMATHTGSDPNYWGIKQYYEKLLNDASTFYLAVYPTSASPQQALVYLTDSGSDRFDTKEHGTSLSIYWNGQWYIPNDNKKGGTPYLMPSFNAKDAAAIQLELDTNWTLASAI